MSRVALDVEQVVSQGLEAAYTTITADGVSFVNNGRVIVHVVATTACDITIKTPVLYDTDLALADRVVSLGASEEYFIGPFVTSLYNIGGSVHIDSDQVDTDIAILRY